MDIVYQFNEKYVPYAGVSITSLLHNNRQEKEIRIFILGENLTKKSKDMLKSFASANNAVIRLVDTEKLIKKMIDLNLPAYRNSYAANMRLFLPDILDESVHRILYLDADTVITGSLDALFTMDMGENSLAMALDSLAVKHGVHIGLKKEDDYYNSGVILFELDNWKANSYTEKIIDHIKNCRAVYPSPDQDLLNVVCYSGIKRLGPEYNYQPIHGAFSAEGYLRTFWKQGYYSKEEIVGAAENAVIYHCFRFIGEFPWDKGNVHPFERIFDKYLAMSAWRDYEKARSKRSFVFRFERLLYSVLPGSLFIRIFHKAHILFIYYSEQLTLRDKKNSLM